VHNEIGYNYRLTNLQAAMGVAQLEQLDDYIAAKRRIARRYSEAFEDVSGITPMQEADWAFSIFWMYTVLVNPSKYGMDSRELLRSLRQVDVQTRPLWQPIHLSPAHRQSYVVNCSTARELNQKALSLPCSVEFSKEHQARVVQEIKNFTNLEGKSAA
jgi:perosamine synthetase